MSLDPAAFSTRTLRALALGLALALALALVAPRAHAQRFQTPAQRLLLAAPSPASLRAQLVAHADSVAARRAPDAGEAWYWAGASWYRAGRADSAARAFRRAWTLRADPDDAVGLAEAWSATGRAADRDSALRFVAALPNEGPDAGTVPLQLWRAYAAARAGDPAALATAARLLEPAANAPLPWVRRFGPLLVAAHDTHAWPLLGSAIGRTHGTDSTLTSPVQSMWHNPGQARPIETWVLAARAREDSLAGTPLRMLGAQPLALTELPQRRVWWLPPHAPGAPVVVLVLSDPLRAFGGLAGLLEPLRHADFGVAIVDPLEPEAATDGPGAEARTRALAADLVTLVTVITHAADGVPAQVALGAEREHVLAAALAAHDDPRIGALLLAGPAPSPVDRGTLVATLAAGGVPAFFQTSVEDFESNQLVDRIAAKLPATLSRVADSDAPGRGYDAFRAGPKVAERFTTWLAEAWKTPRATPPSPRR